MRWILLSHLFACAAGTATPADTEHTESEGNTSGAEDPDNEEGRLSSEPPADEASEPEVASGELCTRVDFMTVSVPPAVYESRNGANATRFSELETSHAKPLEECGLQAVLSRLVRLQCDDGSLAYQSASQAHSSRVGSMGPGGRCGAIIDLYRAQCGTTTHDVFADMYFCPSS